MTLQLVNSLFGSGSFSTLNKAEQHGFWDVRHFLSLDTELH